MPIDDRLRTGLPSVLDDVRPDVDAAMGAVLREAGRRSRVRRTAYALSLVAAVVAVAVTLGLTGDALRRSTDPATPSDQVRVLDSERGRPKAPASLAPGTYAIPFIGAPDDARWAEVEVPTGWGQDRIHLATGPDLDPHVRRIELLTIDRVAADPCEGVLAPVDQDAAAIVSALSEQALVDPSSPRPVTLDGYSGQLLRFHVPSGLDLDACLTDAGGITPFGLGASWTTVFPGWTYRVWVLDVEGDPMAILAAHGPRTTQDELAELTAIVEGTTFVAPR